MLGLLSAAAEERPLLCLVEDAQWLDAASGLILGFVARRLLADSVAIVVAVREPNTRHDFDGLPELRLGGLAEEDARTLLMSAVPGRLDDRVRDRIVAETRGNPLALLDLPRSMSAAELAGGFELLAGDRPPAPPRGSLPASAPVSCPRRRSGCCCWPRPSRWVTRRSSGARLRRSASTEARSPRRKTRSWSRSEPASASGIHWCDPRCTGRRPLPSGEMRIEALAEATDPDTDPDRRAWHRAHAAVGVDEDGGRRVGALGRPGAGPWGRRRRCGVPGARGGADPRSGARGAGAPWPPRRRSSTRRQRTRRSSLLATAELAPLDELQRARLERLRAEIAFARTRGSDAPRSPARCRPAPRTARRGDGSRDASRGDGGGDVRRSPRRRAGRPRGRRGRSGCAGGTAAATRDRPAPRRLGDEVHRGLLGRSAAAPKGARRVPRRGGIDRTATCAGCGWRVAWPRISGTTSSGTCSRRAGCASRGRRARSACSRSRPHIARPCTFMRETSAPLPR